MIEPASTKPDSVTKIDEYFRPVLDANGKTQTVLGVNPYFQNLPKEQWPKDGNENLISTELFQSINPFFIIFLTPIVLGLFVWLKKQKRNPIHR